MSTLQMDTLSWVHAIMSSVLTAAIVRAASETREREREFCSSAPHSDSKVELYDCNESVVCDRSLCEQSWGVVKVFNPAVVGFLLNAAVVVICQVSLIDAFLHLCLPNEAT